MTKDSNESADSEELLEDRQPGASTIVSIVPLAEQQHRAERAAGRDGGDFDPLSSPRKQGVSQPTATDQGDDDQQDGQEVRMTADDEGDALTANTRQQRAPASSKKRLCRTCKDLCCRGRRKRTKSCTRMLCSDFLAARAQALRFKTNLKLFIESEQKLQKHSFMIICCCMLLYFGVALAFPMVYSNVGEVTCSPTQSPVVYGVYGAYVLISTFSEIAII